MVRRVLGADRVWVFKSPRTLTQWYGHVELHGKHAIGQWFCVETQTGRVLWDHEIPLATSICHVGDGVIVASEMQSTGPTTFNTGIFVIDLQSGQMLWQAKGVGCLGLLLSILPGFRASSGTPAALVGTELYTSSGEVLDVRTGNHVRNTDPDSIPDRDRDESEPASRLYGNNSITVSGGGKLRAAGGEEGFVASRSGTNAWEFDLLATGRHVDGNYYSWRFVGDAILIIAADEPIYVSTGEFTTRENACRYDLLVLDIEIGRVVQEIALTTVPGKPCRIESVDDSVVLVSHEKKLWCYAWR